MIFFYLAYCANPALGLNQHEVDECREKAHTYMGPAFRGFFLKTFLTRYFLIILIIHFHFLIGLDAAYVSNSQAICHYWYNGVCHEPRNAKMFPMK